MLGKSKTVEFARVGIIRGPKGVGCMKPPPGLLVPESVGTLVDSPP